MNRRALAGRAGTAAVATALAVLSALGSARADPPAPADLIARNGVIHTVNDRQPRAAALAVADGRIVYVGSNAGATARAGPNTRIIDLKGRTVVPGIIDSHIHPADGEFYNHRLCNVHSYSTDEGYARLAACARSAPAGDWVVAFGWDSTDNPRLADVRLARLDAIVPDRQLAVIEHDSHTVWVNSRTLGALGITRTTPSPVGGRIGKDPDGALTGALEDSAAGDLYERIETRSPYAASDLDLLGTALPYLNGLGITAILDAAATDRLEAAYRALESQGRLSLRVSLAFVVTAANYRTEIPRIAAKRALNSDRIRVDYIKVFADGNAEDGLANMLGKDGRPGPASHGYFTQAQMNEIVRLAEPAGLSLYVHSIGDGAARQVLNAIAAARQSGPCPTCRHTLTHLQWIRPEDIARLRTLSVIANIQEGWLAPRAIGGPPGYDYARDTAAGPLGPALAARMYPFREIHAAGARLAAGSDWFYTDENPWNDLEAGVTSRDPGVAGSVAMLPAHTLDLRTLFTARTLGAAYQLRMDTETGSIEVGKRADFVVLSQNPFVVPVGRVHETRALMTFLDGRQVSGLERPLETPGVGRQPQ